MMSPIEGAKKVFRSFFGAFGGKPFEISVCLDVYVCSIYTVNRLYLYKICTE